MTGTVKWFDDAKGYGFITCDGGGDDVFVHYTGIVKNGNERRSLAEGNKVKFDVEGSNKGPKATNVELLA